MILGRLLVRPFVALLRPPGERRRLHEPDLWLLATLLVLAMFGTVMVFSASSVISMVEFNTPFHYFERQLLYAAAGLGIMALAARVDYHVYRRYVLHGVLASYVLLAVVLIVGPEIGGSRRWIPLGIVNFQPSELAKLAVVNFTAAYCSSFRGNITSFTKGVVPPVLVAGIAFGLIMLEPDFGTAMAVALGALVVLFAAGVRIWHLAGMALASSPLVAALIYLEPYRMRRIMAFLDPWADPQGSGFHTIQALYALGCGRLFGVGLGQSRQKLWYLPEEHTDFIFAIIGEELGLAGAVGVVALIFLFTWRGYRAAMHAPDTFSSLLAAGLTGMIALQAVVNIGVVTAMLPITGIPLPFISYGGSSLVFSLAAAGIVLNVSRYGRSPG